MESSNPFSCGTQVLDWKERNCKKCKTGYDEKNRKWNCWLESTLDYGLNTTGEFNKKFLMLIGYNRKNKRSAYLGLSGKEGKIIWNSYIG